MTRDQMLRIALRYDTALSRAMLRALGVEAPRGRKRGRVIRHDRYDGLMECFGQRHGVT